MGSEPSESEGGRKGSADRCKDVECSTSVESHHRSQERAFGLLRVRSEEEDSSESESGSSGFEFQKAERAPPHRLTAAAAVMPPFSRPARSKWDDAEKWIASRISNREGSEAGGGGQAKKAALGYGSRMMPAKVVLEDMEEADTKMANSFASSMDLEVKIAVVDKNPVAASSVNLSCHESSTCVQSAMAFVTLALTVRAVSMRDTGTEMTPIASEEPSRTGTPVQATSPLCSPTPSLPTSPQRTAPVLTQTDPADCHESFNNKGLSKEELQKRTRKEIMVLGQQLGKMNIAAWASKEEEETNASISSKTNLPDKGLVEARAVAWEEAENTKYLARFKREEIKIQAWENHQKAMIEAEMRKIEVELERMRTNAHEKLMNQLAAVRHKADENCASAEAKRNRQAAKTAQQAEYIKRTGRIPSFSCWSWCSYCTLFLN